MDNGYDQMTLAKNKRRTVYHEQKFTRLDNNIFAIQITYTHRGQNK